MKVAINVCYGGFDLSHAAIMRYAELKGITLYAYTNKPDNYKEYKEFEAGDNEFCIHYTTEPMVDGDFVDKSYFSTYDLKRTDEHVIQVIEELGEKANGNHANIEIIEIPDDLDYTIEEYDGIEHIAEAHQTWG